MSILHIVIARGKTILSEYTNPSYIGSYPESTYRYLQNLADTNPHDILEEQSRSIPPDSQDVIIKDSSMISMNTSYLLHALYIDRLFLLCMAPAGYARSDIYVLLRTIRSDFLYTFNVRWTHAKKNELNNDFQSHFQTHLREFFQNKKDTLQTVKSQVRDVTSIVEQNIQAAINRGSDIDQLLDKSDELSVTSTSFRRKTVSVRRKMWWQYFRVKLFLVLGVLAIIYIAITIGCGGFKWKKCVK